MLRLGTVGFTSVSMAYEDLIESEHIADVHAAYGKNCPMAIQQ